MTNFPFFAIAATSALCLSACAGSSNAPMDTGERISQRGGQISNYGDAWSAGRKDVAQGEQMVEKSGKNAADAQKKLEKARAEVAKAEARIQSSETDRADGQRLINNGKVAMQRAEADYSVIRSGPSANQNAPRD